MVISRRKKKAIRLLQSLNPSPMSTNRGRFLREKYRRPNGKARRHSGRKTIYYECEGYPYMETVWNNWTDYRDGMRDWSRIGKWIYGENVEGYVRAKIKRQYKLRNARKHKVYIV